jgi:glycogen operon protein
MLNAYWEPLNFALPPLKPGNYWHRIIDTALPAPDDFSDLEAAVKIDKDSYLVTARSSVVLMEG